MTTLHKSLLGSIGIVAFLFVAYFMGLNTLLAKASALVFKTDCYTAAATSTLAYMTPGTATTTVTCPMGSDGADSASLAIQVNASSTASVFNVYVEESMDGQDWYPIGAPDTASTTPYNLSLRAYSTFTFASSTIGGSRSALLGASTTYQGYEAEDNRNHYLLDVPVRMKRVRAYTGMTGASGAVWMQIIPKISI